MSLNIEKMSSTFIRLKSWPRPAPAQALVPVLVVDLALLVVGEDLVRLGRLLELRLGLGVARVAVRVVLHRQAAVRALDLVASADFSTPRIS
jgi:hypothetical protein